MLGFIASGLPHHRLTTLWFWAQQCCKDCCCTLTMSSVLFPSYLAFAVRKASNPLDKRQGREQGREQEWVVNCVRAQHHPCHGSRNSSMTQQSQTCANCCCRALTLTQAQPQPQPLTHSAINHAAIAPLHHCRSSLLGAQTPPFMCVLC